MYNNFIGSYNSAFGDRSLISNTLGSYNAAYGGNTLSSNTEGIYNTAIGYQSGSTTTTGNNNTLIGYDAQTSSPSASNEVVLGNGSVTAIRAQVTTLTSLSDARDKKNITDLSLGLNFINSLKPRAFNWDKREWYSNKIADGSKMKKEQTAGFIAQELDASQQQFNAEYLNLVYKTSPDKWEATYGNLLPVIVKSIQELSAQKDKEIEELKMRIKELEMIMKQILELKK
jgi:hypothetical protein